MKKIRHFIDLKEIASEALQGILKNAHILKKPENKYSNQLAKKQLAMIFEKESTRTRVSFEVAINHLGGNAIVINKDSAQIARGETFADTAKVLSRYVDIAMLRTFKHESLIEFVENASIPVINGLTDRSHPVQVMADILTFEEKKGSITGKSIAWVGDCNNMANTWVQAAEKFKFDLRVSCPPELSTLAKNTKFTTYFEKPEEAVKETDLVMTDAWVSMGDSNDRYKKDILKNYQVTESLIELANKDAIFMHCLPAHRGEEVSSSVIDGKHSVIFDEAENRLHIQKAIILWCLGD
jgi:ornithine carbamoyltransferase